jgi:hypothetical protein
MLSKLVLTITVLVSSQFAFGQTATLPTSAIQAVKFKDVSGKTVDPCLGVKGTKFDSLGKTQTC